jgi:hypothetical protein
MAHGPVSAFFLSFLGGIITVAPTMVTIYGWAALTSELGPGFSYSNQLIGYVPSGEALLLFVFGAICGTIMIVGGVIQLSTRISRVRTGSAIILIATVFAAPGTFFGSVFGGILSTVGGVVGLMWKPPSVTPSNEGSHA